MGKNAWKNYDEAQLQQVMQLAEGYKQFLNVGKTERECAREVVRQAEAAGYVDLQDIIAVSYTHLYVFTEFFCGFHLIFIEFSLTLQIKDSIILFCRHCVLKPRGLGLKTHAQERRYLS